MGLGGRSQLEQVVGRTASRAPPGHLTSRCTYRLNTPKTPSPPPSQTPPSPLTPTPNPNPQLPIPILSLPHHHHHHHHFFTPRWEFSLEESPDGRALVLEVGVGRFLDTSLIQVGGR